MADSAPIMISMTYAMRCETVRFAGEMSVSFWLLFGFVEALAETFRGQGSLIPLGLLKQVTPR